MKQRISIVFDTWNKAIKIAIQNKFLKLNSSELKTRLLSGTLWSALGGVISQLLMLIAFIIVARLLGQEQYGEFGMVRSTVNMFIISAGFSLGMTATKHIAEFKNSNPERASRILTLSTLFTLITSSFIAIIVFFSAHWLAENTINAPYLENELKIGAFILLVSAINGAQLGALVGFEAFKTIAKINIIIGVLSIVSLIVGAYLGGLHGAVLALALNISINWIITNYAIRQEIKRYNMSLFASDWWSEKSVLWKFSLPATLGGLMVSPIVWFAGALLVNQPNGYNEMGIFDAANQWFMAILFIPGLISKIVLPILSNLNGTNDIQYSKVIAFSLILNGGIALVIAIIIAYFSSLILGSYGDGFEQGYMVLVYLAFSAVLVSINNVVGQVITSKGKMWTGLFFNLLWALSMALFSWYFIRKGLGAEGLAMAYLISYGLHSLWQIFYIQYSLKISLQYKIEELDIKNRIFSVKKRKKSPPTLTTTPHHKQGFCL
jgi:O-antigen/teichoic acid export membrane protein